MRQKREIKARSVTGNRSGGMEDLPDVSTDRRGSEEKEGAQKGAKEGKKGKF